jgi:hypothetical protein
MRRVFFFLMIAVILAGCKVRYVPVTKTVTRVEHTVDTIIEYQLTPYRDSVEVSDTVSFLFNDYAYSYAAWSGGLLRHSLAIFPQKPLLIEVPKTTVEIRVSEPQIVEVERELSRWESVKMKVGGFVIVFDLILVVFLIGYLLFRRVKARSA